jgi:hypothetical protein
LLTSPDTKLLERVLMIYKAFIPHVQFFVDAYVNYDSHESGYFGGASRTQ